jgi:hypothetical protein
MFRKVGNSVPVPRNETIFLTSATTAGWFSNPSAGLRCGPYSWSSWDLTVTHVLTKTKTKTLFLATKGFSFTLAQLGTLSQLK